MTGNNNPTTNDSKPQEESASINVRKELVRLRLFRHIDSAMRVALASLLIVSPLISWMLEGRFKISPVVVFISLFFPIVGGLFINKYFRIRRHAWLALKSDDLRLIGPLLEASNKDSDAEDLQCEANAALVRLLPKLSGDNEYFLTDHQRDLLRRKLMCSTDEKLTVAIIDAIVAIRDVGAIADMKKLVDDAEQLRRNKRVLTAARNALSSLLAAQQEKQARETLLRPTIAPEEPSQSLLRPASRGEQEEATLLLRATNDQVNASGK